jgi:hypothetical protein
MSRSRARNLGVISLLLTAGLAAGLLWRNAAGLEPGVNALRPDAGEEPADEVAAESAAARDSAVPAKPKRQIVPDLEVVVNIPAGRLELVDGDSVVRSYPVSVGSARYPTPVGDYLLATVIWNPWWNPPPESSWARDRKPEPPGPRNPMGRVKLHMDELIYIHGTTSEGRLGAPASHGCIRMSNTDVVDLARRLHRYAQPSMADAELDRISQAGRTQRHTVMARSVRMRVTYDVARLQGDRLHVYPDVYGKVGGGYSAQVRRQLALGGLDTTLVPAPAMSRLRASGGTRGGASFALAEIPDLRPLPPSAPTSASEPRETGPRVLGTPVSAPRAAPDTIVLGGTSEAAAEDEAPGLDTAPPDDQP